MLNEALWSAEFGRTALPTRPCMIGNQTTDKALITPDFSSYVLPWSHVLPESSPQAKQRTGRKPYECATS